MTQEHHKAIILGAGAAGMMCAAHAASAGGSVLVIDHADAPGEKIRISGGGRCNFTNLDCKPAAFLSQNPHFCKSALKRYTQKDFIALVDSHGIAWHEKTLGQLFCDGSAMQIIDMLVEEMRKAGARLELETAALHVDHADGRFRVMLKGPGGRRDVTCDALVIATGGKSIPKMGATGFAYELAQHFGLAIERPRPGLVPLTFEGRTLDALRELAGVSTYGAAAAGGARFEEALLFTHRGLSGPAILQISSYWSAGEEISVSLVPGGTFEALRAMRQERGKRSLATALSEALPKRLAQIAAERSGHDRGNLADLSDAALREVAAAVEDWRLLPSGSEGWRTAEVTVGGVSTAGLSSKTMEATTVPGLYVIGEAVDVTGWLGGYNFQWAWSSGWAAGKAIAAA